MDHRNIQINGVVVGSKFLLLVLVGGANDGGSVVCQGILSVPRAGRLPPRLDVDKVLH